MKSFIFSTLISSLLMTGCDRQGSAHSEKDQDHSGDQIEEQIAGAAFKEGKGVSLSEFTRKAIGLETVAVSEQKIRPAVSFQVQIYRSDHGLSGVNSPATSHSVSGSASLDAETAKLLKLGQTVQLVGPGGEKIPGKVIRLQPDSLNQKRFEATLTIPDPDRRFRVGTLFEVSAISEVEQDSMVIPKSALLKTVTGTFVYAVNGEHFMRTEVKTGTEDGEMIEIKDGLYSGDEIASTPVMTLWVAELQAIRGGQACADGH